MSPVFLALALSVCAAPTMQESDEIPDGNKLVKVTVIAERDAVPPGGTLTLGVRLAIEPNWHVYWENPGDSGLPTKVEISAPPGFEVGPVRFPIPTRHEDAGDIVTYVHENELVLLVDVQVPKGLVPGTQAAFGAHASWLVCKEICVPGKGEAQLELPVVEHEPKLANEKFFGAARAREPRPWSELTRVRLAWTGEERAPHLSIVVPGATALEYFPYRDPRLSMGARTIEVGKSGSTAQLDFAFERKAPTDVLEARGVLWTKTERGEAAYVLESKFAKTP
jgi:DsbC/DsbD-like thiol-disulfide interchange protein